MQSKIGTRLVLIKVKFSDIGVHYTASDKVHISRALHANWHSYHFNHSQPTKEVSLSVSRLLAWSTIIINDPTRL